MFTFKKASKDAQYLFQYSLVAKVLIYYGLIIKCPNVF